MVYWSRFDVTVEWMGLKCSTYDERLSAEQYMTFMGYVVSVLAPLG